MDKKGLLGSIIGILVIILFILFVGLILSPKNDDCLENLAKDYCEDNDMNFVEIRAFRVFNSFFLKTFMCREDERSISFKAYKFLEDEIEECK